jgi:hypothetical protein
MSEPTPLPDDPRPRSSELAGPEIPGADVDEQGVFRVRNGDVEVFEMARIEECIEPAFELIEPIAWLWPGRIALGLVTVLEGAASVGKSPLVADIVARVTRGAPWPGSVEGPQPAGDVLVVSGELGGWERITYPRLKRSGADLARVVRLVDIDTYLPLVETRDRSHTQRCAGFPDDLGQLEYCIRARPETRLVVIDPLAAYCSDARSWRETLRQLHDIAARRNVAIVVVTGRGGRWSVRSRFQIAADPRSDEVRALFNVLEDVDDDGRRFLAPARLSFCAAPEWLAFRIVDGRIVWESAAAVPSEEALPSRPGKDRGAVFHEVTEWMRTMLLERDVSVQAAMAEAKVLGYSKMTVRRAREHLQVRTYRTQGDAHSDFWWTLQDQPDPAEARLVEATSDENGSKESKSKGAPASPRRAPEVSPEVQANVDPAPTRPLRPRRSGARDSAPRKPARAASPADWRRFHEAVLEDLNDAHESNGDLPFVVPPSGGAGHAGNDKYKANGQHRSNGRHESNGEDDSTGKRPKPR